MDGEGEASPGFRQGREEVRGIPSHREPQLIVHEVQSVRAQWLDCGLNLRGRLDDAPHLGLDEHEVCRDRHHRVEAAADESW